MNQQFGPFNAKSVIAFLGLFHTSVASLAIGIAFVVTVSQVVGYRTRMRRYDLFAKRSQLFQVCIYNIGTINAIGLVFALSGLYPQFWEQLFNNFFWAMIIEEFIFFLLATTVTFHYFFWEHLWGHKRLHIVLGALLTPLFFLQFFMINGLGGFMLAQGSFQEGSLSLFSGILGWDKRVFYNPTFLMLQFHRLFANISYAGFILAGWAGIRLYLTGDAVKKRYYEDNARLASYAAFSALLALPLVGFFYSRVLQANADSAFWDLMLGRGDVVKGGIDLWWLKHIFVAAMIGAGLGYFRKKSASSSQERFSLPRALIFAVACFYLVFYIAMGMVMTWRFFWWMLAFGVGAYLLATHMINYSKGSGRAVFLMLGMLAFGTVMLGGWAREASRPRFVDRYSHYDSIYRPDERQPYLMVDVEPGTIPQAPVKKQEAGAAQLIQQRCTGCHGLDRMRNYGGSDWGKVVNVMVVYGARLNQQEAQMVIEHLEAGLPY